MEIPLEISNTIKPRIVSLLTDFGIKDYYVASLKAMIVDTSHSLQLIDITHLIDTYDIVKASFFIQNCYQDFPVGTIHVVAVNNAYDYDPELICFEYDGHYFIGHNNGLFSLEFDGIDIANIRHITLPHAIEKPSLNEKIAFGIHHILDNDNINGLGEPLTSFDQKLSIRAVVTKEEIRANVIQVDHFDNIIVNLDKATFDKNRMGRNFCIYIKPNDPIEQLSESFSDVPVGELVCLFNENGYLTIAINNGRASSMYSIERNDTVQIMFYGE